MSGPGSTVHYLPERAEAFTVISIYGGVPNCLSNSSPGNQHILNFLRRPMYALSHYWPIALTQDDTPPPIRSIMIGPTLDEQRSETAADLLLRKHGLRDAITIERSGIPYRSI
jgi:hypothetical protein